MAEYSAVEQEQRLLNEKDSVELYEGTDYQSRRSDGWRGWLKSPPPWIAYVFVVYTLISIPIILWTSLSLNKLQHKPYSPINHIIEYREQKLQADKATIYSHAPSDEHNKAWVDLLGPMHMSATREELEQSNDEPDDRLVLVKTVPGGVGQGRWTQGDYLATLGVYHELHCLRRLYWNFYPDIYFVNMTSELMEAERGHARHCIDTIRQSLMCTPNLGLYSFKWKGVDEKPELKTGASRQCVKWDAVQDWSNDRATGWNPLVWKPRNETSAE